MHSFFACSDPFCLLGQISLSYIENKWLRLTFLRVILLGFWLLRKYSYAHLFFPDACPWSGNIELVEFWPIFAIWAVEGCQGEYFCLSYCKDFWQYSSGMKPFLDMSLNDILFLSMVGLVSLLNGISTFMCHLMPKLSL